MSDLSFSKISGNINAIELKTYEKLILLYAERVKNVQGVRSIIQIGSFTVPGLSDIDIIVIVDDDNPPKWEEISIKRHLKGEKGYEVIAHDVFVYPKSLSRYIEGLFYLDRKKIVYGNDIGCVFSDKKIDQLKLILTYEYTIHRLESLNALLAMSSVQIRDILLFISTLRHTYKLLNDFGIISEEEKEIRISAIENLRKESLNNKSKEFKEKVNSWIIPSFESIYESAILIAEKLNYKKSIANKKWILNSKKLIFNIDDITFAKKRFFKNYNINKIVKARILLECMPSSVFLHIKKYEAIANTKDLNNIESLTPLEIRFVLANLHRDFIDKNKYPIAKSYIVIERQSNKLSDKIKKIILKIGSLFL